ncbi:acyl-CoA dehydrogenase/oxidase [Boletus edulis]|nr:acyl-CoA dehydrogenase/oxidase [Boletus edulis]
MSNHPVVQLTSEASWNFAKLVAFLQDEVYPSVKLYYAQIPKDPVQRWKTIVPIVEELKVKARKLGLWNLFLSKAHYPQHGVPLSNLEYAVMAEVIGRGGHVASEAVNCAAPDTGNMEVLARYGSPEQQKEWLLPLLNGEIRSAFAMTERFGTYLHLSCNIRADTQHVVASSDAQGDEIVINGHKWWISGAGDPRTKLHLVMGKSDPGNPDGYKQQSVVIVPADTPGVRIVRHCEVIYENVRVPLKNLILGWGKGFEIIQGRLGPGPLDLMIQRVTDPSRKTFGKFLYEHGTKSRAARLLVLKGLQIDKHKAKGALKEIGIAKFVVPAMACEVVDRAIQAFGAEGVSQDQHLAGMYVQLRALRLADGPDAVGQRELTRAPGLHKRAAEMSKKEAAIMQKAGLKAHL